MNERNQEVLDRLAGRKSRIKRNKQLRQTKWYRRWGAFADFLDTNPSKKATLREMDKLIDSVYGYRYAHTAGASLESLLLVCRERKYKDGKRRKL